jgi:hypothetical protein
VGKTSTERAVDLPYKALFDSLIFETDREDSGTRGTTDTVWLAFLVVERKELDI